MTIRTVDFGRIDAEADENLSQYFVDTGVLGKLRSGRKHYVIGRKGSGKTALFRLSNSQSLGRAVIPLEFNTYPWEMHKLVREQGLTPEASYVASWRFVFLVSVCRYWAERAEGDLGGTAKKFLSSIFQTEQPGVLDILIDRLKRLRKLQLPEATGIGKIGAVEFEPSKAGPVLAQTLSQWCQILDKFVFENFDRMPCTITLDKLDDGWDAKEESKLLLAGALKATRDMNLRLHRRDAPAAIVTFLRSDIYGELEFNDKNKISADIEFLEWPEENLFDVAAVRIARSLNCSKDEAWSRVFSSDEMRQRASIRSYMLKRTMGRPRDIVAFCLNCKEVAIKYNHDRVETSDVYEAEERYSRHIYDELIDEMHKQYPQASQYLRALRNLGKTRFTLPEWKSASAGGHEEPSTAEEAVNRLKVLFEHSVVGIPRKGGAGGGTTHQYAYNDRFLQPQFGEELVVHPSLKKHLQLVEPKRDKKEDTAEADE